MAVTALVVIDLQKSIVAYPTVHVAGGAPGRTEQARSRDPFPADWADLVPELNRQPEDHTVTTRTWGAFTNTDLEEHLKTLGVTPIILAGVATSTGVESTARDAHELGLNVTLAVDAMTDVNPDAHHNSATRIFPRLGETGSTGEILALLDSGHQ